MSKDTTDRYRKIYRLILEGKLHKQIAHEFGISIWAATNVAKKTGASAVLAQRRRLRNEAIAAAVAAGRQPKDIAMVWGLTTARVGQIASEMGARVPRGRRRETAKTAHMAGAAP